MTHFSYSQTQILLEHLKKIQNKNHQKALSYKWEIQARPNQREPEKPYRTWLILAGRGFGKTRMGAETIRQWIDHEKCRYVALISQSLDEVRHVMVDGMSGLRTLFPPSKRPQFERSEKKLVFHNGAIARCYGGNFYDKLRGPQFDAVWIDELAKFKYPSELLDQVNLSLRLGPAPKCIITTTPRPLPLFKKMMEDPSTVVTRGSTFDNEANLSCEFIAYIKGRYASTHLESQELYGELLTHERGALFSRDRIHYVTHDEDMFERVVIAVDPATTYHETSDETGIVVASKLKDGTFSVLDDLSGRFSPFDWGERVIKGYKAFKADRIVAEVNKGGDLVERVIKSFDTHACYRPVRATRGKGIRAEPIAALYEQGKVTHERPLRELETQMCTYIPGETSKSPDRLDAMVWALTELFENNQQRSIWTT